MRIVDALLLRDSNLATGTPDDQMRKWREEQREKLNRALVAKLNEIPRAELDLEALGGRVVEHVPSGTFYFRFRGDPGYVGDDVRDFYFDSSGAPQMLQRASSL